MRLLVAAIALSMMVLLPAFADPRNGKGWGRGEGGGRVHDYGAHSGGHHSRGASGPIAGSGSGGGAPGSIAGGGGGGASGPIAGSGSGGGAPGSIAGGGGGAYPSALFALNPGYIRTLARPGGNVTGLFVQQIEQAVKRLELIREAFPKAQVATVLWDKFSFDQWEAVEKAAKTLGIRVIGIGLREQPYDYERALADAPMEAPGLLVPMASAIFFIDRERLFDCALKHRMATIVPIREMTDAGALMSYGVGFEGLMRRAAEYVDRIARGARPADLPVEQPTKFELVINLKTAKALGVTIPPSLLARADEVIE
jgi:putative ABC transport system substrate-binding protein